MDGAALFGETLRRHRQARHLTQAELAERAGLSERAISDLERGLKQPQRATIHFLIGALQLAPAEAADFDLVARSRLSPSPNLTTDSAVRHNLPLIPTSFVGRDDALSRLRRLLVPRGSRTSGSRLVTLTGAGGCGKTRLAIHLARDLVADFADGVWIAHLASTADAALVPSVVLTALGGSEAADVTPLESLLHRVRGRQLLIVLDNCEHLVDACAEVIDLVLSASTDARVLATSREVLRVAGETAWRVPSLETPEPVEPGDPDQLLRYEAVRLFVDRIVQVDPNFALTAANATAVGEVCRRLDGIPLALELAAARGSGMSVPEIAARLDDCFHLLTGGGRGALPRQRTLRATIDWSHDLLSEPERVLFRRLAVFAGGWTLEAAEIVTEGHPLARAEILDVLMRLIDQSLVSVQVHAQDGRSRYRFLETVRAYAAEQLHAAGETADVQVRHREWCVNFAERAAEQLTGPDGPAWFGLLTSEQDNVRAALDACGDDPTTAEAELRLAAAMARLWCPRKPVEGRRRLAQALARAPHRPSGARSAALTWQATFELYFGDPAIGRGMARAAASDARAIGDARRAADALWAVVYATEDDDAATRITLLEEGLALLEAAGVRGQYAWVLGFLAAAAAESGDLQRARTVLDEADALARAAGDVWSRLTTLTQLGWLALGEGRLDDAEAHFRTLVDLGPRWGGLHSMLGLLGLSQLSLRRGDVEQAWVLCRQLLIDHQQAAVWSAPLADVLAYAASVLAAAGLHARAQRLLGAREAWYAAHGGPGGIWLPHTRAGLKRGLVPIPPPPTDAALAQSRAAGRTMRLEEAVAYALAPMDAPPPGAAALCTPR